MIAMLIDSFTRDLEVSIVSISEVPGKGLVLRWGATVGKLWQLVREERIFRSDLPILVAVRGYQAFSSNGFVTVGWKRDSESEQTQSVIGVQGFPWMFNKALKPCKSWEVSFLRQGAEIREVVTHARCDERGRMWHSNVATASAAEAAIQLRSKIFPLSVFVLEETGEE